MKNYFFIFCTIALASSPLMAMTLKEAMAKAIEYSPDVQANDAALKAAQLRVASAWLGLLPSAVVSKTYAQNTIDMTGIPHQFQNPQILGYSFSLPLFDGGYTVFSSKGADAAAKRQAEISRQTKNTVAVQAGQAYVGLVFAKAQWDSMTTIEGFYKQVLTAITDETEKAQIQLAIQRTEAKILASQQAISDAKSVFAQIIGVTDPGELDTVENLIKEIDLPKTYDDAIKIALRESPGINSIDAAIEATRDNKNGTIATSFLPQVNLVLQQQNTVLPPGFQNTRNFGVTVGYSFNPRVFTNIAAAKEDLKSIMYTRESIVRTLTQTLRSSYDKIDSLKQSIDLGGKNMGDSYNLYADMLKKASSGEKVSANSFLDSLGSVESSFNTVWNGVISAIGVGLQVVGTLGQLPQK